MALGELAATGSSALPWSEVEQRLAQLIADFGPPSRTARAQSAAYPFTRLRSDGVWTLSEDVPMDRVGPLSEKHVIGRLVPSVEAELSDPATLHATARALVDAEFPSTVAGDVLAAVGFDPEMVASQQPLSPAARRRDAAWPSKILAAWDRQCGFCGFDGQLGSACVAIEAAHVRWFNFGGPDEMDNGLALCSLHHKLFDRGVLGLTMDHQIKVSAEFTTRTPAGRLVYDLAGRGLQARRGTSLPAAEYVAWHDREVFKGVRLAA